LTFQSRRCGPDFGFRPSPDAGRWLSSSLEYGVQKGKFKNSGRAASQHMGILAGDWTALALILAGALAGGFVNGLTGFGTALTALPLFLLAVEPIVAAQLVCAASVVGHLSTLGVIRHAIDWRRLAPMLAAGLVGVPIGTWILPWLSVPAFKQAVGTVIFAYCAFMLFGAGRIRLAAGGKGAETVVGFAGGILGGIAGLSGALPTMWAALKGWPKEERRVFLQVFNLTILSAMLVASLLQGMVGQRALVAMIVALPGTLVGARLGSVAYHRLDDHRFDRVVLVLLLLAGLGLAGGSR
jgi:uncharacterized membrane protein YfcA